VILSEEEPVRATVRSQSPRDVARGLGAALGTNLAAAVSGPLSPAVIRSGDKVIRLLILYLNRQAQTLAIAIEQSRDEYDASALPPARHMQEGLPMFPDSRPRFYVRDDRANLSVEVSETAATPAAVQSHLGAELAKGGWRPVSPDTKGDVAMRVYTRGAEICCTYVGPSKSGGQTITVLHKKQGLE